MRSATSSIPTTAGKTVEAKYAGLGGQDLPGGHEKTGGQQSQGKDWCTFCAIPSCHRLRHCPKIAASSGLFFCPPAASQKGLHIWDMRPFLRLAAGQNPGAIRLTYFRAMPNEARGGQGSGENRARDGKLGCPPEIPLFRRRSFLRQNLPSSCPSPHGRRDALPMAATEPPLPHPHSLANADALSCKLAKASLPRGLG